MAESKHKHARPKGSTRGRLAVGVVVIGAVVLFRLITGGAEDPADAADELSGASASRATEATEWIAKDGSAYRITLTPSSQFVSAASSSGCITVPAPGTTNLRFTVKIENRSPTSAAVPSLEFAANVDGSGAVDPELRSFAEASKRIELQPSEDAEDATARSCAEASQLGTGSRDRIGPGSSTTFAGTLAGVRTPLDDGLSLIVRYAKADAQAGSGSVKVLVMVPFAAR